MDQETLLSHCKSLQKKLIGSEGDETALGKWKASVSQLATVSDQNKLLQELLGSTQAYMYVSQPPPLSITEAIHSLSYLSDKQIQTIRNTSLGILWQNKVIPLTKKEFKKLRDSTELSISQPVQYVLSCFPLISSYYVSDSVHQTLHPIVNSIFKKLVPDYKIPDIPTREKTQESQLKSQLRKIHHKQQRYSSELIRWVHELVNITSSDPKPITKFKLKKYLNNPVYKETLFVLFTNYFGKPTTSAQQLTNQVYHYLQSNPSEQLQLSISHGKISIVADYIIREKELLNKQETEILDKIHHLSQKQESRQHNQTAVYFTKVPLQIGQTEFFPGIVCRTPDYCNFEIYRRESKMLDTDHSNKIHLACRPEYQIWTILVLLKSIRRSTEETLEAFTGWQRPHLSHHRKKRIHKIGKKLQEFQSQDPDDRLAIARHQDTIARLSYLPFSWSRHLVSGKFGTQYCSNTYNPGLGTDPNVNWGYPRMDPFPPIILYPTIGSLFTLIAHLESVFPENIQRHISSGLPPFANVAVSPLLYMSYSDTEKRIKAFQEKDPGWRQTTFSSQQYEKCHTYTDSQDCNAHSEYCQWDGTCTSRPIPDTSEYQIPKSYPNDW